MLNIARPFGLRCCSTLPGKSTGPHSTRDSNKQVEVAPPHLVKAVTTPSTFPYIDQLVKHIKNHFILHEPGRFLIIPKPFGVSCVGYKQADGGIFKDSVHNKPEDDKTKNVHSARDVTIQECIPYLQRLFNEPRLEFCIGLKRYMSGPIILPANKKEFENIKKSIRFASTNPNENGHHRVLAFVIGRPPTVSGSIQGYSTFQAVGNHKEYTFVEGRAKRRAKSGKYAIEGTLEWDVIGTNYGVSLVDLTVPKFARHLPRVMLSHLKCPIVGDNLYTNRLANIDGKSILVDPKVRQKHQVFVPLALISRLGLSHDQFFKLPMMFHVYRSEFPRYGWTIGKTPNQQEEDVADLIASMPPPGHFLAMVDALGLSTAMSRHMQKLEDETSVVSGETQF